MDEDTSSHELNLKLDSLSLKILRLMNEYIKCKLKLEQTIKDGCLNLAKARYLYGSKSISALQLPTEESSGVKALTKVVCCDANSNSSLQFSLSYSELPNCKKDSNLKLRSGNDRIIEVDENKDEKISDPLKWFGVLVPQNLRYAQSCFKQSLELSVDCVNIQAQLESNRLEFSRLLKLKKEGSQKKDQQLL